MKKAYNELGGLDILVLNAGLQQYQLDIQKLPAEQLRDTFEVNVFSVVFAIQEALNYLKAGASIILTSSIQGVKPSAHLVDYAMTKSSLISLTKSLAAQLGEKGIRINAVAPGPIWTALQISGDNHKIVFQNLVKISHLDEQANQRNLRALMYF